VHEDRDLPVVSLYLFFRAGSRNEHHGITGISHLFEHMMFNGSKKYQPKEFDRILEGGGGYSNAYTGNDITLYYEEFNPDLLDKVLDKEDFPSLTREPCRERFRKQLFRAKENAG
jgi:predicted Zn-dependent peptidase